MTVSDVASNVASESTTVPFEFIRPGIPLVVFEASINRGQPARFVLDSGNGAGLILAESYACTLGLTSKSKKVPKTAFMVGGDGPAQYAVARVESLRIGEFEVVPGKVTISGLIDDLNRAIKAETAGNIGHGILKDFAVRLDYGAKTLTLVKEPVPQPGISFDLARGSIIVVDVTVDGRGPFRMVLDTGASATVFSPVLAQSVGIELREKTSLLGAGGHIESFKAEASVVVGDVSSGPLDVFVSDFFEGLSKATETQIDGVVGYDFLRSHTVTLDYPNRTLRLDAPQ
jgi:predicted aspartyl protease